jgi:hypothetical protein
MTTYKRIDGDYVITTLNATDTVDINTAEVTVSGNLIAIGNVQSNIALANFFIGDGQFLTNVVANTGTASKLQNGTSNVDIPVPNGNIIFGVDFQSNVMRISTTTVEINLNTAATNWASGALVLTGGIGTTGNIYANIMVANTYNGTTLSVSGNVTGNNLYGNNIYANGVSVLTSDSTINGGSYAG